MWHVACGFILSFATKTFRRYLVESDYQPGIMMSSCLKRIVASKITVRTGLVRALSVTVGGNGGAIWQSFVTAPDTPAGFTLRGAWDEKTNPTGATTILEQWEAGSEEPPHSHPGDDATIVIEGKMSVQFFNKDAAGKLVKDGAPLYLSAGQTGYIAAGRIHDAKYTEKCKIVYVHSGGFGFHAH